MTLRPGRPSAAKLRELELATKLRELELDAARATTRADIAEAIVERLITALTNTIGSHAAAALAPFAPAPATAPPLDAVTPRVEQECDRWADTPRQRAVNLNFCYDLARKGKSEAEIITALRRGERTETTT